MWGGVGRCGEVWGGVGRFEELQRSWREQPCARARMCAPSVPTDLASSRSTLTKEMS